MIGKDY